MGYEKFKRPVLAPSFDPEPDGIPLADLAHGTDGRMAAVSLCRVGRIRLGA